MARIQYWNTTGVKCTGAEMRFSCVLIRSLEDKEWLCLLQRKKKETLEQLCAADLGMEMCQKNPKFVSLANNEQADWTI